NTRIESMSPVNSINDSPASRPTANASSSGIPSRRAFQATARYIAPVLMKRYPSRRATARAAVLLPAPAGPSMAMIKPLSANMRSYASFQNFPDDLQRLFDLFAAHVVMRDHSHFARVDAVGQRAARFQLGAELGRGHSRRRDVEDHDVGLYAFRIDFYAAQFGQPLGQPLRVRVVFDQDFGRVFERDQAGGGQHSSLPHSATHYLARGYRFSDEVLRAGDHRTDGSAQAFRQTEHYRIEGARDLGDCRVERD